MNRPKQQGTRAETDTVKILKAAGLQAWRLAEGGSRDAGDVAFVDGNGDTWVVEVKHRERLSVHDAYAQAKRKAQSADVPFMVAGTVLVWKRSELPVGGLRRVPAGTVIVMDWPTFLDLLPVREG
jgi:hypothetical protein